MSSSGWPSNGVRQAAGETGTAASQMQATASELSTLADRLQGAVGGFLAVVRSGG